MSRTHSRDPRLSFPCQGNLWIVEYLRKYCASVFRFVHYLAGRQTVHRFAEQRQHHGISPIHATCNDRTIRQPHASNHEGARNDKCEYHDPHDIGCISWALDTAHTPRCAVAFRVAVAYRLTVEDQRGRHAGATTPPKADRVSLYDFVVLLICPTARKFITNLL